MEASREPSAPTPGGPTTGHPDHPAVEESVEVQAPAALVWALVSDPMNYPMWSPEATATRRTRGSGVWSVGDTFRGANKARLPWTTMCTVVEADFHTGFSFRVNVGPFPVAHWGYRVEPLGTTSSRVTETWHDARTGLRGALMKPSGLLVGRGWDAASWNRRTMRATLLALKAHAEAGA